MLNEHEKEQLRLFVISELKDDYDKFDTDAEIDSSLSYQENKNILCDKIKSFRECDPLRNVTRGSITLQKQQIIESEQQEPRDLIQRWIKGSVQKSRVYAVIGSRGSGKSCFSFAFLEWHNQLASRRCYVYKFPKPELLPIWIKNIDDIQEATKGGCLLIDEAGIEFNQFSFNSKKSVELANMLKTARHKDLSIIFIAQNGANLTRDIRRLVDCYILRAPSFTQLYDEISIIKRMYQNCLMLFSTEEQKRKGFYIAEIGELAYCDMPSFWTEEISKAYDGRTEKVNISGWILQQIAKRKP